jgi:hypothetical protein
MDMQTYMPPMAAQLNDVLAGMPASQQTPPGYATMGVLPPKKSKGPPQQNGTGNPYSYSPINVAPKYTAEDARELLFGKGSGWRGGEDIVQTNSQGKTIIPAPYLQTSNI